MKGLWLALAAIGIAVVVVLALSSQPRLGGALAGSSTGSSGSGFRSASSEALLSSSLAQDPGVAARGIVVVGEGEAKLAPDVAFVSVGVQTRAQTAKEAQQQNNATMSALLAAVKALGIPEKDIQTSGISLWPVTQRDNQVSGYQATNTVTVRVADVGQAGAVLDAAVGAGANTAGSLRFGLQDPDKARQQALEAATKDARAKADVLAKAAGLQITGVESVVELESSRPMPVAARALEAAQDSVPMPIEPGEVTVVARLRITYSH